ncbi:hypothetical protein GF380_00275 [Candidatus Uhrbacteria bacterium]|nr:hypothetical protein [Candidatus Uhrbacteria bacterium]
MKEDNRPRTDLQRQLAKSSGQQRYITIRMDYMDLLENDHLAAILLDQIGFWTNISKHDGSWFWKKYPDWFDEIRMTQYQVKRAVNKIKKMSKEAVGEEAIETDLRKINNAPTLHYRVVWRILENWIIKKLHNQEHSHSIDYEETSHSSYIHNNTQKNTNTPSPDGDDTADTQKPKATPEEIDAVLYQNGQTDSSLEKALDVATATPKPKGPREKSAQTNSDIAAARRNGSGGKPEKGVKKARLRDVVFDAVAEHIFGIHDLSKLDDKQRKSSGGRIGKISAWIKKSYPGANEATIKAFTEWYGKQFEGAHIPLDYDKFTGHFITFAQEKQAVKTDRDQYEWVPETKVNTVTGQPETVMVKRRKVKNESE